MPDPILYRRIPIFVWDGANNRPQRGAFHLREGEDGLSVFDASLVTPRAVLQNFLDGQQEKLASGDPAMQQSAQAMLDKYGATVEELVANGWRVARLPASAFVDFGYRLGDVEAHPRGHRTVYGAAAEFKRDSAIWIKNPDILPDEEVLASNDTEPGPGASASG